jgi:hypothetical protein
MPARSAAGLVAKAQAIKSLDEDTDRQAAIAASLRRVAALRRNNGLNTG